MKEPNEEAIERDTAVPATKLERSAIAAKAGLKVGGNYARYLARRAVGRANTPEDKKALHRQNAKDLYQEFTKLRGTALKLAQGMSMDMGTLPDEFAEIMTQAQYSVPPMNRALVRKIIRDAFGQYPEQLFASFDGAAIAAASIGQVHRATLKDGREVAVKVQYPNVRDTIKSDLALGKTLIKRIVKADNIDAYVDEVGARLYEETDYLHEAQQLDFFSKQYDNEIILTPEAIHEYTRANVLTMTFIDGVHMDAFLAREPPQARIDWYGQRLWDFIHEQIASNVRTIHADIHPGNFLFRDDGKLGVLDFGCVKTFPQDFRDAFLRLFRAQMTRDTEAIRALFYEVDILHDGQDAATQQRVFDFFSHFGQMILRPYRTPSFDFSDPTFRTDLNASFKEATKLNEVVGSEHFIYINKVMVGLFGLLLKLKPTIDTAGSLALLNRTIDQISRTD
ncbi:MAG: AarF/ABC1/UbiB kinase family protein [Rhodothermales bacterium]